MEAGRLIRLLHLNIQIFKYTNWYFRLLPEGFPWPARPFKHRESNLFNYTFKNTLKYTDGTRVSYYLRCLVVWPALHIFKFRYATVFQSIHNQHFSG